ncbi:hypothetical protein [Pararhodobacter zhoushanensis]|uniref:Uncharacterized protein n=1 Tax=Pararhodobacter zhoushanensis TaxID=2479545 RepID=A0ABT3H2S3_9RHOB|nr:hypothetical protein [Pararhodobacter zhoushanensis]MCW1934139.1 hypothetical protein [Pararhodobacter zhoushanensis]
MLQKFWGMLTVDNQEQKDGLEKRWLATILPFLFDEKPGSKMSANTLFNRLTILGGLLIILSWLALWLFEFDFNRLYFLKSGNEIFRRIWARYVFVRGLSPVSGEFFLISAIAFLPYQILGTALLLRRYRRNVSSLGKSVEFKKHVKVAGVSFLMISTIYLMLFYVEMGQDSGRSSLWEAMCSWPVYPFFFTLCCLIASVCWVNILTLASRIVGKGKQNA